MTDTAETMLERVAIAIGETISGYLDPADAPIVWDLSMIAARAAIAAMAGPTDAMVLAAKEDTYEPAWPEEARAIWSAMIQAALAEKPE